MTNLQHLTITTGDCVAVSRAEIPDEVIAVLTSWLGTAVKVWHSTPVPREGWAGFRCKVWPWDDALQVTVYAPSDKPDRPLVSFCVAPNAIASVHLWDNWCKFPYQMASHVTCPPVPWCAVTPHRWLVRFPETREWLDEFERGVAWAWIEWRRQIAEGVKERP